MEKRRAERYGKKVSKKGMLREARENVLEAIASRFNRVPDDIAREVENIHNRAFLKLLLRQAVVCIDLEVFRKTLNEQTG